MWELFQKILAEKLTPNQALILFANKEKISISGASLIDKEILVAKKFLIKNDDKTYVMSPEAKRFCID